MRTAVFSDPYPTLPHYRVERSLFGPDGQDEANALRAAAKRTLSDAHDLIEFPSGQKLFQANGICFAGTWRIDADSAYTGLFSAGTKVPAIVRASVMLSEATADARRTFGLAVKLFPLHEIVHSSVNVLTMSEVAGTDAAHFLDVILDNHPDLGGLPNLRTLGTALRIRRDLMAADRAMSPDGPNLWYRPVDSLAEVNIPNRDAATAPHWIRFRVDDETPRNHAADFRDELRLMHYPNHELIFRIEVADETAGSKANAIWRRLGALRLSADVVSETCDLRLHFAHPRVR